MTRLNPLCPGPEQGGNEVQTLNPVPKTVCRRQVTPRGPNYRQIARVCQGRGLHHLVHAARQEAVQR